MSIARVHAESVVAAILVTMTLAASAAMVVLVYMPVH